MKGLGDHMHEFRVLLTIIEEGTDRLVCVFVEIPLMTG